MKLVFELNLPPITDLLLDSNRYGTYKDVDNLYINEIDLGQVLKPNYLEFLNFKWNRLLFFRKKDCGGTIHSDTTKKSIEDTTDNRCAWAINWVLGSDRLLRYWYWENVESEGPIPSSTNKENDKRELIKGESFKIKKIADESYILKKGSVYLIYATIPHVAYGIGSSESYSLRDTTSWNVTWENIVERFDPYIIKKDTKFIL